VEREMEASSLTIAEWCAHRRVSRSMFYKLDAEGLAPRTHNVGVKRLISPQADADWLRQREAASDEVA
jgi:predicted DNA-binding transcriptional regulator AlpA